LEGGDGIGGVVGGDGLCAGLGEVGEFGQGLFDVGLAPPFQSLVEGHFVVADEEGEGGVGVEEGEDNGFIAGRQRHKG